MSIADTVRAIIAEQAMLDLEDVTLDSTLDDLGDASRFANDTDAAQALFWACRDAPEGEAVRAKLLTLEESFGQFVEQGRSPGSDQLYRLARNAALLDRVRIGLERAGDSFAVVRLWQHRRPEPTDLARVQRLVLVYPTWWGGQPAMLLDWYLSGDRDDSPQVHSRGAARIRTQTDLAAGEAEQLAGIIGLNERFVVVPSGYTEEQLRKLWSENLLRVWREVEKVSASL